MRGRLGATAMIAAMLGWRGPVEPPPPQTQKCALPGCDKQTKKAYCCAEHCRQHRESLRKRGS